MRTKQVAIQGGQVLLAEPFMLDPYFRRSVVLLCEHHDQGSVGFILNKTIEMGINDLMMDFPRFDCEVFYGGPVQTDTLHYIHNVGHLLDGSIKVSDGVWWGGNFDKLKALVRSDLVTPENIRFFVGYSGWTRGQLHDELEFGSWLSASMDANYVFKTKPRHLWSQVMYDKGDQYEVFAHMPEVISWN